jgi:hypothetical protein
MNGNVFRTLESTTATSYLLPLPQVRASTLHHVGGERVRKRRESRSVLHEGASGSFGNVFRTLEKYYGDCLPTPAAPSALVKHSIMSEESESGNVESPGASCMREQAEASDAAAAAAGFSGRFFFPAE